MKGMRGYNEPAQIYTVRTICSQYMAWRYLIFANVCNRPLTQEYLSTKWKSAVSLLCAVVVMVGSMRLRS